MTDTRIFVSLILSLFIGVANAQNRDSLDLKIGQMLLIGVPGTSVDPTVLKEIKEGKAGSIIFFEKNIDKANSYANLKKLAWTYQQAAPIPLFVSIDQEGGKVNRLKEKYGFPRSISAAAMSSSLDSVRFYAETTAATLAGLGININFAPVVDLGNNPNNPIIAGKERSFSANENQVAACAREFINAHRKIGVITVLKHFPGHGSSKDDTHLGIADVTSTWEPRELAPYQQLIDSGFVDAVMTAHIVNRKLDKSALPGTLSKPIIDSLLRKTLHWDGVVFSDDMQMHAIEKYYGLEDAVRLAINAGVDVLTISNNIQGSKDRTVDVVHSIIRRLVSNGTIPMSRIDESYARIMKLKSRLVIAQDNALRRELAQAQIALQTTREALAVSQVKADSVSAELKKLKDAASKPERKKSKKSK